MLILQLVGITASNITKESEISQNISPFFVCMESNSKLLNVQILLYYTDNYQKAKLKRMLDMRKTKNEFK